MPKTTLHWISNALQSIEMILAALIGSQTMGWTATGERSQSSVAGGAPPTYMGGAPPDEFSTLYFTRCWI